MGSYQQAAAHCARAVHDCWTACNFASPKSRAEKDVVQSVCTEAVYFNFYFFVVSFRNSKVVMGVLPLMVTDVFAPCRLTVSRPRY